MNIDAYFGKIEEDKTDWRKVLVEDEPDDDEDRPADQDVIDLLGFDPDELDWDEAKSIGLSSIFTKVDMTRQDWLDAWKEDPHWADSKEPSKIAKDFFKLLKKDKKNSLLEIGCGMGRDSIYFAKQGVDKVIGIDLSPDAIKIANKNRPKELKNLLFEVGDAEKLKYKDEEFDSIYSLSVLHSTNMKKSFKEINRVTQDKSLLLFYLYIKTKYEKEHTEVNFKIKDVEDLFKRNNFRIIDKWKKDMKDEYDEENPHIHYIVVYTLRKEIE